MAVITRAARHSLDPAAPVLPAFCACKTCQDFAYESTGGRRRGWGRTTTEERATVRRRLADGFTPRHRAARG